MEVNQRAYEALEVQICLRKSVQIDRTNEDSIPGISGGRFHDGSDGDNVAASLWSAQLHAATV